MSVCLLMHCFLNYLSLLFDSGMWSVVNSWHVVCNLLCNLVLIFVGTQLDLFNSSVLVWRILGIGLR